MKKRGIDINVKFGEPTYRFFVYENAKPELVGTINATFHGSADGKFHFEYMLFELCLN